MPLSIGELLTSAAAVSNGSSQVSVNLAAVTGDTGIVNASLDLGAKPTLMSYDAYAEVGDKATTSQFNLNIGSLGKAPATLLKVDVELASAEVEVDTITCNTDGTAAVTLKASTNAAKLGVKAPILPKIQLNLGSNETKSLSFSQADITAKTYKPVRSGLGLQVGALNLTQILLIKPVDDLLVKLGLNVAEADVRITDANCGSAGLVY